MIEAGEDDGKGSDDEMGAKDAPYKKPDFAALTPTEQGLRKAFRRVPVPPQRMTPLKASWMALIQPLIEHLKLQVRMNTRRKCVEIRSSEQTQDVGDLQKAADYMKAFM